MNFVNQKAFEVEIHNHLISSLRINPTLKSSNKYLFHLYMNGNGKGIITLTCIKMHRTSALPSQNCGESSQVCIVLLEALSVDLFSPFFSSAFPEEFFTIRATSRRSAISLLETKDLWCVLGRETPQTSPVFRN